MGFPFVAVEGNCCFAVPQNLKESFTLPTICLHIIYMHMKEDIVVEKRLSERQLFYQRSVVRTKRKVDRCTELHQRMEAHNLLKSGLY